MVEKGRGGDGGGGGFIFPLLPILEWPRICNGASECSENPRIPNLGGVFFIFLNLFYFIFLNKIRYP